jgi:hypothetical protein
MENNLPLVTTNPSPAWGGNRHNSSPSLGEVGRGWLDSYNN